MWTRSPRTAITTLPRRREVTADFDNVAGYLAYRDHPRHREIVANYIAPIRAEGAAVQYEF